MTRRKITLSLPPPLGSNFVRRWQWRGYFSDPRPLLFVLVLFFTIISSFSRRVLGMALVFDSAMYLHSSVCVLNYFKTLSTFHLPSPDAYKLMVEGVLLDGPILPLLGGLFFLMLGLTPDVKNMGAALFLQALLQAGAALLVYKITFDLTGKKLPSAIAGYAWGFYPPAILGAGKFMTEILSTNLLLGMILCVSRIKRPLPALGAGLLLGCVALTKAALLPTAALMIFFGLVYLILNRVPAKQFLVSLIATACGVTMTIGPWVVFTHHVTGKMLITTNRQPTHNLVSGVNPENDGWASLPETPLGNMFTEEDPALPSAMGIALANGSYELQLMARKIVRLFTQPWNDYRLGCLLMPLAGQIIWHKMLLVMGIFGMVALLMDIARKHIERAKEMAATRIELIYSLLMIAIVGHFIYLPFVACSRYGFTALPMFTIFAILGLSRLFGLGKKTFLASVALVFASIAFDINIVKLLEQQVMNNHNIDVLAWATAFKLLLCLISILTLVRILRRGTGFKFMPWPINTFLVLLVGLLLGTAAIDTYYEPMNGELVFKFSNSRPLLRSCVIGDYELKNPYLKAAYLLLDSRTKTTMIGHMSVNGQTQSLFLAPFYLVHPEQNMEGCYEMFAKLRFQKGAELNQWYLAEIPTSTLKAGKNEITVTPDPEYILSINGTPRSRYLQGNYVSLPSLSYFSPTLLMNDLDGYDARPRQWYYIATGKGHRIQCTADRNLDGDYDRTNLNTLVLLVYRRPGMVEAPPSPLMKIDLFKYFVSPH